MLLQEVVLNVFFASLSVRVQKERIPSKMKEFVICNMRVSACMRDFCDDFSEDFSHDFSVDFSENFSEKRGSHHKHSCRKEIND